MGESREGVREKGEGFLHSLAVSFPSRAFLKMPATQAKNATILNTDMQISHLLRYCAEILAFVVFQFL